MFETRIFFIIFARCASTVFTLIFNRVPISLFLKPAQINSRISCSREVSDSGRFSVAAAQGRRVICEPEACWWLWP